MSKSFQLRSSICCKTSFAIPVHSTAGGTPAADSPVRLRAVIVNLMDNVGFAEKLGLEAGKVAPQFTPEQFFERMFAIVEESTRPKEVAADDATVKTAAGV